MIVALSKITIYVDNQEEAKKFWIEKMGFKIMLEQPMGGSTWLEVAPTEGGTAIVLYDKALMQGQGAASTEHPSVFFSTTDLEETHKTLTLNGVKIDPIMKMPYGSMCSFHDQDNNSYMLREDK